MDKLSNKESIQRYAENDLEYKVQAKELLTKSLGFEPPVLLSMKAEVAIRKTLREIDEGQDKQKALESKVSFHTDLIKKWIPKYAPEYNHLLNKHT